MRSSRLSTSSAMVRAAKLRCALALPRIRESRATELTARAHLQVLQADIDLLHPPAELEKRSHKLKRLVQSPNSFFMDVKCQGCFQMCALRPFNLLVFMATCATCARVGVVDAAIGVMQRLARPGRGCSASSTCSRPGRCACPHMWCCTGASRQSGVLTPLGSVRQRASTHLEAETCQLNGQQSRAPLSPRGSCRQCVRALGHAR